MKHLTGSNTGLAVGLVALIVCALGVGSADAAPITVPSGLEAGDSYRLAFVTSGIRDAQSTDVADYNAFVTAAANSVVELLALDTQWFAIASTASVDARDNTGTTPPGDVPVFLLNDTMLATSYNDLWDWSIAVPLGINELGEQAGGSSNIWTGTTGFGTVEQGLGSATPTIGSRAITDNAQWVRLGVAAMTANHSLYAISDVLTIPSVPTKSDSWGTTKALYR